MVGPAERGKRKGGDSILGPLRRNTWKHCIYRISISTFASRKYSGFRLPSQSSPQIQHPRSLIKWSVTNRTSVSTGMDQHRTHRALEMPAQPTVARKQTEKRRPRTLRSNCMTSEEQTTTAGRRRPTKSQPKQIYGESWVSHLSWSRRAAQRRYWNVGAHPYRGVH